MKRLCLLLIALAGSLVFGSCETGNGDDNEPLGDFTMNFTDFGPHLNQDLRLKIKDASSGDTVAEAPVTFIEDESFTIEIANVLESGETYNIDAWADVDDNGELDGTPLDNPPGLDHAWRFVRTADAEGITFTYMHDTNFTDIRPF